MLSFTDMSSALREACHEGWIEAEDTAVVFYDFDMLDRRIAEIKAAFPPSSLHSAAVKACPFRQVLRTLIDQGFGLEVASMPELQLALELGCGADRIVFDSPAKTREELRYALVRGIRMNADNLDEIRRIEQILAEDCDLKSRIGKIGLRINPQVGIGGIEATSVAGISSKFGEPIQNREEIFATFARCSWLNGLHLHSGSQAIPLELMCEGVARVWRLRAELEELRAGRVLDFFDIGGGLPVCYREDQPQHDLGDYLSALEARLPELFQPEAKLVTEFGRYLFANAGWAATRVEYVKPSGPKTYAITHLGADFMLRQCYQPGVWHHAWYALDRNGWPKSGETRKFDIAGPLCFGGDVPAREVLLPELQEGDWLAVRDCGAYSYAMWSRYNSRQAPQVLGYAANGKKRLWQRIKARETVAETLAFWG